MWWFWPILEETRRVGRGIRIGWRMTETPCRHYSASRADGKVPGLKLVGLHGRVSGTLEDFMVALIVGLLFIAFSVVAVIPGIPGFDWSAQVINFLKGGAPVLAVFIGLIAIFIGIADIKDRIEAKKEEAEEAKQAEKQAETK
jgi:hypothetical protein